MGDFSRQSAGSFAGALNTWDITGGASGIGEVAAPTAATAWPAANRAIYCPVLVDAPITIKKLGWFNGTVSGNVDAGIYDINGTKVVSTGSTAMSGASAVQSVTVSTTLNPGVYFLALACDNGTATFFSRSGVSISTELLRVSGFQQQASGFALPATATFANPASAYFPLVIASPLTVI